ncbi:hypothetical protein ACWHLZ_34440 [Streptomyces chartreusis]
MVDAAGRRLVLSGASVYLVDLQQSRLVDLLARDAPAGSSTLDIDGSLGGLAYRTQHTQRSRDGVTAWVPLIDGVERIGVLKITAPTLEPELLEACEALAGAVALLVVSMPTYSEALITHERSRAMTIQAELLWAFSPRARSAPGRSLPARSWNPPTTPAVTPSITA